MTTNNHDVPQMRLRTGLVAGESVNACMRNLDTWRRELEQKCARKAGGYAPYQETEMKPWQAGSV
jgi:hypothetical protein